MQLNPFASKSLTNGYLLDFSSHSSFSHHIGGHHGIEGAICPNCELPLMLHVSLDTRDERLRLANSRLSNLPLLYCCRCSLSWHPFVYTVINDHLIQIQRAFSGPKQWEDWYSDGRGDTFPEQRFEMKPITREMQMVCDKLNAGVTLSDSEELHFATEIGSFATAECGGYPIVDTFSQIGGRSFLSQRLEDPECEVCRKRGLMRDMFFLCSLVNDRRSGMRIGFDGVQIVFFFCKTCSSVHVVHSI